MISRAQIKFFRALKKKKYRERTGLFLAEGIRLCEELLTSDYEVECLLCAPALLHRPYGGDVLEKFEAARVPIHEVEQKAFLTIADTQRSQGLIAVVKKKPYSLSDLPQQPPSILLASDGIKDPGNLGTMIRTADWFGIAGLLLSENSVEVTNPKVVRSSMGSIFHLPMITDLDLNEILPELKQQGHALVVTDATGGGSFYDVQYPAKNVIIMGNEDMGVSDAIKNFSDIRVSIPRNGHGESLNVAVSTGILLAEITRSQHIER